MKVKITIAGISECDAMLAELSNATGANAIRRALTAAAAPVVAAAKERVPVDTGIMKAGISVQRTAKGSTRRRDSDAQVFIGVAGKHASLAHLVEFGTAHSAPQPFMRPAWDANRDRVFVTFKSSLKAEVEKALSRFRKRQAKKAAG